MEILGKALSREQLASVNEQMPKAWYENRWLIIALSATLSSVAANYLPEKIEPQSHNLAFQTILAVAYLTGRFLDYWTTLRVLPIVLSANKVMPSHVQFYESAKIVPDHPDRKDFFRRSVAVTEGVALALAFTLPPVALGVTLASSLAIFSNYRNKARAELILAEAERC